ncbi:MAG: hypothetical protein JW795_21370 [Chitinivibrionales bacterium]|nr:hypothetical protein [Chitinivibrionales bacterium]
MWSRKKLKTLRSAALTAVCFLLFFCVCHSTDKKIYPEEKQLFTEYILGMQYITSAQGITDAERIALYRKLSALTGFSGKKATDFIQHYTDNPSQWKKILMDAIAFENTLVQSEIKKK